MKQIDLVIQNPTGLHARPAKVFVTLAKQYKSTVRVQHGEKVANAKSLISMLTLGAETGSQIRILVEGEDEEVALAELEQAVRSGLGESDQYEAPPAVPAPVRERVGAAVQSRPVTEAGGRAGDVVRGISAAPGIAIGPVYQLKRSEIVVVEDDGGDPLKEEARLKGAIEKARSQLERLRGQLLSSNAASEAAIFDVHLELIDDAELLEAVLGKIQKRQSAPRAWQSVIESRAQVIAALKDPLLSARAADLHDVGYRVLRIMMGAEEQSYLLPEHPVIVVARDMSPSDTASLDRERVLGFCTAAGGPTSHTAIIARALSLPAVVSAGAGVLDLADETVVILNGVEGTLVVDPPAEAVRQAEETSLRWQQQRSEARKSAAEPALTRDGKRVEVVANIGGLKDARQAISMGAEGVGLLRTEFLFLDRTEAPSETEQFEVYRDIAQAMQGLPVIVRTLDIGGDKPLPYVVVPHEENPFLGERGIRLCLARPDLFRQQLRAILRASAFGTLRIMFPMVADLAEWCEARALVDEIRVELNAPAPEMGIMIEVPSAALMADAFAREVDFFSIGTNDLTQYTLAMDRMHPTLAGKSDGLHPAVLRLIATTVQAAHKEGKWVGVCGELGADAQAVPILVGLGVDELSVSVPAVPTVKAQIRTLDFGEAQSLAEQALRCATAPEVRQMT
ncbi:MAG TPA: phosphoenolpyruvate--protein phosphotransferase [Anaerolineales bacterium]